jgi:hypothetical protein
MRQGPSLFLPFRQVWVIQPELILSGLFICAMFGADIFPCCCCQSGFGHSKISVELTGGERKPFHPVVVLIPVVSAEAQHAISLDLLDKIPPFAEVLDEVDDARSDQGKRGIVPS